MKTLVISLACLLFLGCVSTSTVRPMETSIPKTVKPAVKGEVKVAVYTFCDFCYAPIAAKTEDGLIDLMNKEGWGLTEDGLIICPASQKKFNLNVKEPTLDELLPLKAISVEAINGVPSSCYICGQTSLNRNGWCVTKTNKLVCKRCAIELGKEGFH